MSISFVAVGGTTAGGSTSIDVAYPAGLQSDDLLVLEVVSKYVTPTTPSGWTLGTVVTGGKGTSGVDSGEVTVAVYYKLSTGSESGNLTVSIPSGNSAIGRMVAYRCTSKLWTVAFDGGADGTSGTAWSVSETMLVRGHTVVMFSGANSDAPTMGTYGLSASGITFGTLTQRVQARTSVGDDCMLWIVGGSISSGEGEVATTYTATANTSGTNYPCGATAFMFLTEGVTGALDAALDDFTLTAEGLALGTVTGELSVTLDDFSLTAEGQVLGTVTGKLSVTLEDFTLQAEGEAVGVITGELSVTLADFALQAEGGRFRRREAVLPYRLSRAARTYGLTVPVKEDAMSRRKAAGTMQQGVDEVTSYVFNFWRFGTPSSAGTCTLYDETTDTDVSDKLTGDASLDGTKVRSPKVSGLEDDHVYRLTVAAVIEGETVSGYVPIRGER